MLGHRLMRACLGGHGLPFPREKGFLAYAKVTKLMEHRGASAQFCAIEAAAFWDGGGGGELWQHVHDAAAADLPLVHLFAFEDDTLVLPGERRRLALFV